MFSPPTAKAPSPAVPGAHASGAGRTLDIRVVSATPPAPLPGRPAAPAPGELFIPAGSILTGVLLNGLDAPTGQGARQQPTPALVRIKHDAILPNRFRADVKECFAIVGGFGDLGSERAYLRAETLTCVRTDGGVIEVPLDAYAVGEDGKVGVRGRLVSKQGALLAKALQAGFLTAFSKVFTQVPATSFSNAATSGQVQFQSMFTPQAAEAGFAGGIGGAMDKLADYYMKMAENTFPVLEVDAGRGIELIVNKGTSLRLK
jgi:conjugal transfer pilus assembly protein TraB